MVRLFSAVVALTSLVTALATPIEVGKNATEKVALSTGRVSFSTPVSNSQLTPLQATWFYVGLGACGYSDVDSSPVVAISAQVYNNGAECNRVSLLLFHISLHCINLHKSEKWLQITNTATGATALGQVRDKCPGCGADDIGECCEFWCGELVTQCL